MFRFSYLPAQPIISNTRFPELGGNINGPTLISASAWLNQAPARYLLYFAHHEGQTIRLATSDHLTGPWVIHHPPPLDLASSLFATSAPREEDLDDRVRSSIAAGEDGNYPHIASPEVWIDHENHQIRLYYHGRLSNGQQCSRVAISDDGIHFQAQPQQLGNPYLRLFRQDDYFYALAMPAQLYRSRDGLTNFEVGPQLTDEPIRHHALLNYRNQWFVFWTRVGDSPERILLSEMDTRGDWQSWKLTESRELHRPFRDWEGADIPAEASQYGGIMHPVNQLRDPAIYRENDRIYLLYAIAGEQGIAIGELKPL